MRKFTSCLILLAIALPGAADTEEPDPNQSPYQVNLALDLGITLGAPAVLAMPRFFVEEYIHTSCGLTCNKDDVNGLDRQVIGNYSETANILSDVGDGVTWSLPFVLGAIDVLASDPVDGWLGYGKDSIVMIETLSISLTVSGLLQFIVQRPRPLAYDVNQPDETRLAGDTAMSFPSGHCASAFALATAYSYTFTLRHPESPLVVPMWLGTYSLATATGMLRVEAGHHFWTDVIAGSLLGIGLGLLIPYLHECPDDSGHPRVTLLPMITPGGGFGAALTIR